MNGTTATTPVYCLPSSAMAHYVFTGRGTLTITCERQPDTGRYTYTAAWAGVNPDDDKRVTLTVRGVHLTFDTYLPAKDDGWAVADQVSRWLPVDVDQAHAERCTFVRCACNALRDALGASAGVYLSGPVTR